MHKCNLRAELTTLLNKELSILMGFNVLDDAVL